MKHKTIEDVGTSFYKEAVAIHDGKAPERAIMGTPTDKQVKKLKKKGVPFILLGGDKPKPN